MVDFCREYKPPRTWGKLCPACTIKAGYFPAQFSPEKGCNCAWHGRREEVTRILVRVRGLSHVG